MRALLTAALFALAACTHAPVAPRGALIDAPAGAVQGEARGDLLIFKGIPYAAPPVGAARWRAPQPMPRWSGVRQATAFGPACIQPPRPAASVYAIDIGAMSEDCLSLNIWAPAAAQNAPVFVWVHGGSLQSGASSEPMYNGARLAERGLIVVSINYRLGVLGFLAHPELSAESAQNISGNYGLLDQIEALRWIQRNIAAFGGDPANVTLAGESAGGLSVAYLLTSPAARGLFAKAIIQSANILAVPELREARYGMPSAEASGARLATTVGAASIEALRAMDARDLTIAATGFAPRPTIDGVILLEQAATVLDRGEQAPVPILIGFNADEIRTFPALAPQPAANAAAYEDAIRERYRDLADRFLHLYPSADQPESIQAATRDGIHGWTAERLARRQTALGQRAYLYFYDHTYPAADAANLRAFHASELPYIFGALDAFPPNWPPIPNTEAEQHFSAALMEYWTSFARDGVPHAHAAPAWPAYGVSRAYMHFAETPRPAQQLLPGMYELTEEIACRRRNAGQAWGWAHGLAAPAIPPRDSACAEPR